MNEDYKKIFSCIDNTTLEGCDTKEKVRQLCQKSLNLVDSKRGIQSVAAVCVYPIFVKEAHELLKGSGINVASVAGGFPAGQIPLKLKLAEVQYAIDEGADEIDMVISRGALIEGDEQRVADEIVAIREVCKNKRLKVILETGELLSEELITKASMIAMESGADFIKTSTGKIKISATLEAAKIMLESIAKFYKKSGKIVGFKAAGGISTPEQALLYMKLAEQYMGTEYINKQYFRIGASRLTDKLFSFLTNEC